MSPVWTLTEPRPEGAVADDFFTVPSVSGVRRFKIYLLPPSRTPGEDGAGSPLLYEIHTRDWLLRFSTERTIIRLDELPDDELDRLAELGFDWLWLLGVWQTGLEGAASRASS